MANAVPNPPAKAWSEPKVAATYFYAYTIKVGGAEIGTFERYSQRSTRTVERIRQIMAGSPEPVAMVWAGADTSLELNRVELFETSLMAVFGAFANLDYLTVPLDIVEVLIASPGVGTGPGAFAPSGIRTNTFINCVVSEYSKEVSTGQARVIETMTVQVRCVQVTA